MSNFTSLTSFGVSKICRKCFVIMIAVKELHRSMDFNRTIIQEEETEWEVACSALAQRLGEELRAAKSAQLSCGEVLLPRDLLPTIASQILAHCAVEPCGLRGCTLDIQLETEEEGSRVKISSIQWDPQTSSTFLLSLTLRLTTHKWRLSQLLKTLTEGRTVVISDHFQLEKTRFYRSRARH